MSFQASALLLALTPFAAADVTPEGFGLTTLPNPAVSSAEVLTLSSGQFIANDGSAVRLFNENGSGIQQLGGFGTSGVPGALAVDPTERYVIAGEASIGRVLYIDLVANTVVKVADLPGNYDATFESDTSILISSAACNGNCGSAVSRIDTETSLVRQLFYVDDAPGVLEVEPDGDVLYATRADQPGTSSTVYRFDQTTLELGPPVFFEKGGFLAVEIESVPPVSQWAVEDNKPGYTGESFYRWTGPNFFGSPGNGQLVYDLEITNGGLYFFIIHNRHDDPLPDMENDVWVRMDNGPWRKVFSNGGTAIIDKWNWISTFELEPQAENEPAQYDLTPGSHRLIISARSNDQRIDRFHLYQPSYADPFFKFQPESPRGAELAQAATLFGGVTDVTDLERIDQTNNLFVSEYDTVGDLGRILRTRDDGQTFDVVFEADAGEVVDDMRFLDTPGPGLFDPFQAGGGGDLSFQTDSGIAFERLLLEPDRPQLNLSGPGSQPAGGQLDVTVGRAPIGSAGFVLAGPTATDLPFEQPIPGLSTLFSKLNPLTFVILPGSITVDGNGQGSISYTNPQGSALDLTLQSIFLDTTTFEFVATSNLREL